MKAPVAHDGYGRVAQRLALWALASVGSVLMIFSGLGLVVLAVSVLLPADEKSDHAAQDIGNIQTALHTYRAMTGAWPPEANWGQALVEREILEKPPVDPWDHPYRYRLLASDGGVPEPVVTSVGRDGVPNTDDDLPRRTSVSSER